MRSSKLSEDKGEEGGGGGGENGAGKQCWAYKCCAII